jgi:hypothetical protein
VGVKADEQPNNLKEVVMNRSHFNQAISKPLTKLEDTTMQDSQRVSKGNRIKKTLALALVLLGVGGIANATTWWQYGVLYGNVCRSGIYFTVYPLANGQPVGSVCPVRDGYGNIIAQGVVTNE